MTAKKKTVPKMPEPFVMADDEDDNIFFASAVEAEGHDAVVEIALVVDVKNEDDEDSMEYLYTVYLEREELKELQLWIKKALKYIDHVEQHGVPVSLILGVQDNDGDMEGVG